MLGKILTLVVILLIIYIVFFKSRKKDEQRDVQSFVQCDKCGTFISLDEAILSSGKYICKECIKG
ncbi:hypothetical protein LMG7974_00663 [Campylobacter majalis]|uniref:Prokaryotic metallothionein family protein n=1 Tax=Campylobacter majalis TaxID=2790656 RepID=A0ABM8Q4T3_9BACT|nr:PP0621 family protein [Campylobacter majalis]CAD7287780.1 hypothetical protein LMG7974_00663 [Campylobacter majalis]